MTRKPDQRYSKDLVRIARRCWVAEDSVDLAARCAEVLRSSAPHSVIAGAAAARLHKMWLPDLPDVIEIATTTPERAPRHMTRTRRPEFRARRLTLAPDETTVLGGVVLTTPARTWRDLAAELGLPALVAAGDSVLHSGTTAGELAELLARGRGARGIVRARAALPLLDPRSRSRPESHLRVAVSALMVRFAVNEPVYRDRGGWLAEPDLSLPAAKLALEYQGEHHANPDRMRRDMTRFADLRAEGWLALPYGPAEVFGRPWQIEAEVRAAIRERAPALLHQVHRAVPTPSDRRVAS